MTTTVDWADLLPELLHAIANNLRILSDYVRFRAVCTTWRSSTPATPRHLPPQFPWLMLPQSNRTQSRAFFDIIDNKLHLLLLPEASHNHLRRCGSSKGYLPIVSSATPSIILINPLTRSKITTLPPLSRFPNVTLFNFHNVGREYALREPGGHLFTRNLLEMRDSFIKKIILSDSPKNDPNFVAMAIVNQTNDLAFCRNGDDSWKIINDARSYCEDVIYANGLFYAVNKFGGIAVCDINAHANDGMPSVSFTNAPWQIGGDMQYLVSGNDGELLLVTRFVEVEDSNMGGHYLDNVYRTSEFRVFRLVTSNNVYEPKWERVSSLGDKVLFLGENESLALSASDYPGSKGNRIYFTDDYTEVNYDGLCGDQDLGVYNMEDGSIESLPCYPRNSHYRLRWPPPIWVTPNPC